MVQLELHTLTFVAAGLSFIIAALMFAIHVFLKTVNGPLFWSFGHLGVGIGFLLFGLHDVISVLYAIVFSNFFILSGACILLAGLWAFKGKPMNYYIIIGLPLLMVGQSILFTYVIPDIFLRKICSTILLSTYPVLSLIEVNIPAPPLLRIAYRISFYVFGFYTISLFFRGAFAFVTPQNSVLVPSFFNSLVLINTIICIVSTAFCYLLMITFKMSSDIEQLNVGKNRLYAIIGHDLRGPVGTMNTFMEHLLDDEITKNDKDEILSSLKHLAGSTQTLLENLLEWTQSQLGEIHYQPCYVSLKEIIENEIPICNEVARSKNITIQNNIDEVHQLFADKRMLKTVTRNLVMNAIKFTPSGGYVELGAYTEKEKLVFFVKDTGVGMTEEQLNGLFNFSTTNIQAGTNREPGSGLGLVLCEQFIKTNKGHLKVESAQNIGTTVFVTIPKS